MQVESGNGRFRTNRPPVCNYPYIEDLSITAQPPALIVSNVGSSVKIAVSADGPDLKYQWQYSIDDGETWENTSISGNKTSELTVTVKPEYHLYRYRCIVTNSAGTLYSGNTLLSIIPKITSQPTAASVKVGEKATFSVSASGVAKLTYKWYVSKDGGSTWSYYKGGKTIEVPGNIDKDG